MDNLPRLNRNVPLAQQAADILRHYIKEDFVKGGRLPGELQLAEQIGVNRATIRQALKIIEQEGLILRRQGSGTYANPYVIGIKSRIDEGKEFQTMIRDAGYTPEVVQLALVEEPAEAEVAARLEVELETPLIISRQKLLANGVPAVYVVDTIPKLLIKEPYESHELVTSRFDFLLRRCHAQIAYSIGDIFPRLCGKELSRILELEPWQPVLQYDGTAFDMGNRPIMGSTVCYRDPLLRFQVRTRFVA